ncbi:MAG: VWA domain-containing protein [Phycisphaerae bacterium]|nr:VWA domain-containing protein [Phycisphaerae bacterium]
MPQEHTETFRDVIYSGPFSVAALVGIAVAALAIVVLLAWRESRGARPWLWPIVAVLRMAAVAVVLWMLAGQTLLTTYRHTRPKAVGLLVDTSKSMGVVDPVESPGAAARWASALDPQVAEGVRAMDGAAAALSVSRRYLGEFAEAFRTGGDPGRGVSSLEAGVRSLEQAAAMLGDGRDALPTSDGNLGADAGAISDEVQSRVLAEWRTLKRDYEAGRLHVDSRAPGRLRKLGEAVATCAARAKAVADAAAAAFEAEATAPDKAHLRRLADRTRREKVDDLLSRADRGWLAEVRKKARVIAYDFASQPVPSAQRPEDGEGGAGQADAGSPVGGTTDLAAALEQMARDGATQPLAAVVLCTDGGHNSGRDPDKVAAAMSHLPVFVVPVGNPDPVRDVILHHVQGPRTVFVNDQAVIECTVDAYGCAGEELVVELLDGETVVESRRVPVASDVYARQVSFGRKAEVLGRRTYTVRVSQLPDERVADNNAAEVAVEVIEDKLRVLLADNLPRWEHRYLSNLWRRDERVECDELVFEPRRDDGRPARGTGWPATVEAWRRYQVVILGDLMPSRLGAAEIDLLEKYVGQRGGTAIVIAGTESMPEQFAETRLMQMLPVEPWRETPRDRSGFALHLTALGRDTAALQLDDSPLRSEGLWRDITQQLPLYELSRYSKPKATAQTLIEARPLGRQEPLREGAPVFLCWQTYGRGKVMYLSAPATYQLRFRHGDRYHHRLWGQLLRWAAARDMDTGSKTVRIAVDKNRYTFGEEVQVSVRLSRLDGTAVEDGSSRVVARLDGRILQSVDLKPDEASPGLLRATLEGLPAGPVRLEPAGATVQELLNQEGYGEPVETIARIDPPDELELRNTRCNLALLGQVAEATGGAVMPPTALEAAMGQLDLSPEVTERTERQPTWARWACLWVFLGCLTAEWIVRKLGGMA